MMTPEEIIEDIDAIVDDLDPTSVEDLMQRSGLPFQAIIGMITNELKARLVIE